MYIKREMVVKYSQLVGLIFIIAMTISIVIQVFWRYVLNNPLLWPEELARYLFIWIAYIGLIINIIEQKNYKIDIILIRLPIKVKMIVTFIFNTLILFFLVSTLYGSLILLKMNMNILSPAMHIAMDIIYMSFPLSALVIIPNILIFNKNILVKYHKYKNSNNGSEIV